MVAALNYNYSSKSCPHLPTGGQKAAHWKWVALVLAVKFYYKALNLKYTADIKNKGMQSFANNFQHYEN